MTAVWQQIFALDARYNANRAPNHPNFRTLYIRRRNQLLKECVHSDVTPFRKQYLKTRTLLLQQRYGIVGGSFDQVSIKSRSIKSVSRLSDTTEGATKSVGSSDGTSNTNSTLLVPTKEADASRAIVGGTSISDNYAFVGVHHIYDQHTDAVSTVKFANNDRSRLCCASRDGALSLCNVTESPPTVDMMLRDHKMAVTNCDWSISNDLLVSSSLDCTLRLWDTHTGKCLRVVADPNNAEILSCLFQPANNNLVITGNSKGVVSVLNISTGIYTKEGTRKPGGRILSLCCDTTGNSVWAGSDRGAITWFHWEAASGRLNKRRRVVIPEGCGVTCLSYRAWASREARDPCLLVNCTSNMLNLYSVIDSEGQLKLRRRFSIRHTSELIRSTFCPIMSFRQGACIVSGSEDSCVYFFDIEKTERAIVNKLQGHACPVLGVSFNYDESLLATSDLQGLVIIWKKGI